MKNSNILPCNTTEIMGEKSRTKGKGVYRFFGALLLIALSFTNPAHAVIDGEQIIESNSNSNSTSYNRSPWRTSFFNWSTQSLKYTQEGTAQLSSYNYFSFSYKLSYDSNISIRPTFMMSSAGKDARSGADRESDFTLGDIFIQHAAYNVALLPGNFGLTSKLKLYIPTSESSKASRKLTELRGWFMFTKPLGRGIEFNYHIKPELAFFAQRGKPNFHKTTQYGNKPFELWNQFELAERITPDWGLSQSVGYRSEWYYDVPSENRKAEQNDFLMAEVGGFFKLGSAFFRATLMNEVMLNHSDRFDTDNRLERKPLALFRSEDTKLSLMTYVSF